jgi:hypothetical protein
MSLRFPRTRPTRHATLRSTMPNVVPAQPPVPLLLWGPGDEVGINPQHPGAWPARFAYVLAIPVFIARNAAEIAYSWWISRKERAVLRRRGLL